MAPLREVAVGTEPGQSAAGSLSDPICSVQIRIYGLEKKITLRLDFLLKRPWISLRFNPRSKT
jgi:hypothetical protein